MVSVPDWLPALTGVKRRLTSCCDLGAMVKGAAGVTGWNMALLAEGVPLDPWGHPYLLAYNGTLGVMIIYSSGPNGTIETNAGSDKALGDDLLYKFR